MNQPSTVTAVYFSPTHGTRACARMLAGCFRYDYSEWDLTLPPARRERRRFAPDGLVILAVPVYCGRVPPVPGLLDRLEGNGCAAVITVVYGNRAFDDAALELADLAAARGFVPVAMAALVAPHCYIPEVGEGRPDERDRQAAAAFAAALLKREKQPFTPPGNRPYKPYPALPFLPETVGPCSRCGVCEEVCPTGALRDGVTDPETCLRCMACVRFCPRQCRTVSHPAFTATRDRLAALKTVDHPPVFLF